MRRDFTQRRRTFMNTLVSVTAKKCTTLEIGVAAGDFSNFMLDNLDIIEHHMVDPWINEGDHLRSQWFDQDKNDAEQTYMFVLERFKDRPVKIIRKLSNDFFRNNKTKYDLIYIDGDHHSIPVFNDLKNAMNCLKPNGVLCGDDYNWTSRSTGKQEVRIGVEMFEDEFNMKFNIVKGDNNGLNQYWYKF